MPNTHIYFVIEGNAAKDIYAIIDSQAQYDLCQDDGTLIKTAKNIQCTFSPPNKIYTCYFSLGVNDNDIGLGVAC